jgi:hypothetical protein
MVVLAKNAVTECSPVIFRPQKVLKMKSSLVGEQSICLEIKCQRDVVDPRTLRWVDVYWVSKCYLTCTLCPGTLSGELIPVLLLCKYVAI